MHQDTLQLYLEHAAVPVGDMFRVIRIPNYIVDTFLIDGCVKDLVHKEIYTAPAIIPKTANVLEMVTF